MSEVFKLNMKHKKILRETIGNFSPHFLPKVNPVQSINNINFLKIILDNFIKANVRIWSQHSFVLVEKISNNVYAKYVGFIIRFENIFNFEFIKIKNPIRIKKIRKWCIGSTYITKIFVIYTV